MLENPQTASSAAKAIGGLGERAATEPIPRRMATLIENPDTAVSAAQAFESIFALGVRCLGNWRICTVRELAGKSKRHHPDSRLPAGRNQWRHLGSRLPEAFQNFARRAKSCTRFDVLPSDGLGLARVLLRGGRDLGGSGADERGANVTKLIFSTLRRERATSPGCRSWVAKLGLCLAACITITLEQAPGQSLPDRVYQDAYDGARMSIAAYGKDEAVVKDLESEGWTLVRRDSVPIGLDYSVWQRRLPNGKIVATLALGGTANLRDGLTDLSQVVAGPELTQQYKDAIAIAEELISQADKDLNLTVKVAGHSLGGGLAQVIAREFGIQAITFNAAPIQDGGTLSRVMTFLQQKDRGAQHRLAENNVSNIRLRGDLVSSKISPGRQYGQVFTLEPVRPTSGQWKGDYSAHSVQALVDSLLASWPEHTPRPQPTNSVATPGRTLEEVHNGMAKQTPEPLQGAYMRTHDGAQSAVDDLATKALGGLALDSMVQSLRSFGETSHELARLNGMEILRMGRIPSTGRYAGYSTFSRSGLITDLRRGFVSFDDMRRVDARIFNQDRALRRLSRYGSYRHTRFDLDSRRLPVLALRSVEAVRPRHSFGLVRQPRSGLDRALSPQGFRATAGPIRVDLQPGRVQASQKVELAIWSPSEEARRSTRLGSKLLRSGYAALSGGLEVLEGVAMFKDHVDELASWTQVISPDPYLGRNSDMPGIRGGRLALGPFDLSGSGFAINRGARRSSYDFSARALGQHETSNGNRYYNSRIRATGSSFGRGEVLRIDRFVDQNRFGSTTTNQTRSIGTSSILEGYAHVFFPAQTYDSSDSIVTEVRTVESYQEVRNQHGMVRTPTAARSPQAEQAVAGPVNPSVSPGPPGPAAPEARGGVMIDIEISEEDFGPPL